MNMYDYWFDASGGAHEISKMETFYIQNCLKRLKKMLVVWSGIIPEQLTKEEMKQKDEVGMKAWFVLHGISYIDAFCQELDRRKDS